MHFQDAYNYDIERVKGCVIYYAPPDGKLYPFGTYNSEPCYREEIERQFSIPWDRRCNRLSQLIQPTLEEFHHGGTETRRKAE